MNSCCPSDRTRTLVTPPVPESSLIQLPAIESAAMAVVAKLSRSRQSERRTVHLLIFFQFTAFRPEPGADHLDRLHSSRNAAILHQLLIVAAVKLFNVHMGHDCIPDVLDPLIDVSARKFEVCLQLRDCCQQYVGSS